MRTEFEAIIRQRPGVLTAPTAGSQGELSLQSLRHAPSSSKLLLGGFKALWVLSLEHSSENSEHHWPTVLLL